MKKMLITLTTVGVLAIPAGMAFAQTDTTEPAAPVPTCVDPLQDQVRDRDRDRDRDNIADHVALGEQVRQQLRTHQQEQLALQDGTCDADCTGDQARLQNRSQFADGTGLAAEHRLGEMGNAMSRHGNG